MHRLLPVCPPLTWAFTLVLASLAWDAHATRRYYKDLSAESPSKRYRVEARSPDNEGQGRRIPFQASFVYRCLDTAAKQVVWTRKQAMEAAPAPEANSSRGYGLPEEGSPLSLFVSDGGWTVIRTGWDELIVVDLAGKDRGRIGLLSDAFTPEERARYVSETSAGPRWSGYSLWYFLEVEGQPLFSLRPWWGRRVVLNLETGKLLDETTAIRGGAVAHERSYVLAELAKGIEARDQWEKEEQCEAISPVLTAAYLAGRMNVLEAVPLLDKLQDAAYVGTYTSGGLGMTERFDGEVNPHSYETFTLRQVVHLSLRRLGKTPRALPLTRFDVQYDAHEKNHPYTPIPLAVSRGTNAGKVKPGMQAEQVLDLLGAPDFVGGATWEYDMDGDEPFSLTVTWDARHVLAVEKRAPALWTQGFVRDEQVVR